MGTETVPFKKIFLQFAARTFDIFLKKISALAPRLLRALRGVDFNPTLLQQPSLSPLQSPSVKHSRLTQRVHVFLFHRILLLKDRNIH
jgi:hypothetical protein